MQLGNLLGVSLHVEQEDLAYITVGTCDVKPVHTLAAPGHGFLSLRPIKGTLADTLKACAQEVLLLMWCGEMCERRRYMLAVMLCVFYDGVVSFIISVIPIFTITCMIDVSINWGGGGGGWVGQGAAFLRRWDFLASTSG